MSGNAVRVFRSTDTGAPALTGTLGSLITFLDALLVTGYNSRTLTSITRDGSTATATFTAHGYPSDGLETLNISGANQAEYNGDFKPFNVTANSFDFTVTGTPATPATGVITAKMAPAGWTKAFSGTNKAVYKSSEVTSTQMYLRVDDSNPKADTNRTVTLRGYEIMTDVDSGTGPFPTVAQMTDGVFLAKSSTSDAVARNWFLFADGFEFILFYSPPATYPQGYKIFHFGDFASEMYSDPYGCLIFGDTTSGSYSLPENGTTAHATVASLTTSQAGHYVARGYSQTGTSIGVGKVSDYSLSNANLTLGMGSMAYPSPHNNGLYVAPIYVNESSAIIRGTIKCIYNPLHTRPLGHGSLISGLSNLPDRTLMAIMTANSTYPNVGEVHVDITGPWR